MYHLLFAFGCGYSGIKTNRKTSHCKFLLAHNVGSAVWACSCGTKRMHFNKSYKELNSPICTAHLDNERLGKVQFNEETVGH